MPRDPSSGTVSGTHRSVTGDADLDALLGQLGRTHVGNFGGTGPTPTLQQQAQQVTLALGGNTAQQTQRQAAQNTVEAAVGGIRTLPSDQLGPPTLEIRCASPALQAAFAFYNAVADARVAAECRQLGITDRLAAVESALSQVQAKRASFGPLDALTAGFGFLATGATGGVGAAFHSLAQNELQGLSLEQAEQRLSDLRGQLMDQQARVRDRWPGILPVGCSRVWTARFRARDAHGITRVVDREVDRADGNGRLPFWAYAATIEHLQALKVL